MNIAKSALLLSATLLSTCLPLIGQRERAISDLVNEAKASYDGKNFELSLKQYSQAIQRGSTDGSVAYNAACCAALTGDSDRAFQLLNQAMSMGWLQLQHMQRDSDLASLRNEARWTEAVATCRSLARLNETRWSDRAFQTEFAEDLSDAEKAAGLSKLWAEVKFNFVNFHLVPELDWDAEYVKCMTEVLASQSTLEYYRLLERLVARLNDAHTNVFLPARLHTRFDARPALRTRLIEGRILVVKVLDSKTEAAGVEVGQEVLQIDGRPAEDYAEAEIAPYVAASTPQDRATRTYETSLLRGPVDEKVRLKLRSPDGTTSTVELPRRSGNRLTRFLSRPSPFSIEILDGNVAHVRLNSFGSAKAATDFGDAFDEIAATEGLILDLRENGGGSSGVGWTILGYLTDRPFRMTQWHTLQYRPTYRAWDRQPLSQFGSAADTFNQIAAQHYQKPVTMLVGPRTFSAAEDMAAAFDMLDRGKIVGQPTGGSTGQPLLFSLPGGGRARVCTKHDRYADGTEFVGSGIQPDIVVRPTVQDVIDGVDRALEVARNELQK